MSGRLQMRARIFELEGPARRGARHPKVHGVTERGQRIIQCRHDAHELHGGLSIWNTTSPRSVDPVGHDSSHELSLRAYGLNDEKIREPERVRASGDIVNVEVRHRCRDDIALSIDDWVVNESERDPARGLHFAPRFFRRSGLRAAVRSMERSCRHLAILP